MPIVVANGANRRTRQQDTTSRNDAPWCRGMPSSLAVEKFEVVLAPGRTGDSRSADRGRVNVACVASGSSHGGSRANRLKV